MYGFSISKKGIITNNYFKELGYFEEPEPQGAYVLIKKTRSEIKITQDFCGSFGLYLYENKDKKYFALSNSFLLLEEYLIEKQNISFNKEFADNFIVSRLCTPSIQETLIKEIIKLPSNTVIMINLKQRELQLLYIDYKENTILLESKEGLRIIDKWVDKWGYIFRSLSRQTENLSFDLSGGFDTRTVLSILISSGLNLNKILIRSATDTNKNPDHIEDFIIASNISSKFGFKLNDHYLDNSSTIWSTNDTLFCTMYSKLGFHKEFYLKNRFYHKPRFVFTGNGGENIRGYPGYPIKQYIEGISSQGKEIIGQEEKFYNSSMRLCKRSVDFVKKEKAYENDYEISSALYAKGRTRNHYGKSAVEGFLANIYLIQPLIDPDIKQIKFNINEKWSHDLIAYIYYRFAHDLIYFPIQGKRPLNPESIKKAEILIYKIEQYKIKKDLNEDFFIDKKRFCPVSPSNQNKNADVYLKELIRNPNFTKTFNKVYNNEIFDWAQKYSEKTNFFPLRHIYGLLAVVITLNYLSLNKKYMNKS